MENITNYDELLSPTDTFVDITIKDNAKQSDAWRKIEDYKMRKAFEADLAFFDEPDASVSADTLDDIFHH